MVEQDPMAVFLMMVGNSSAVYTYTMAKHAAARNLPSRVSRT